MECDPDWFPVVIGLVIFIAVMFPSAICGGDR